MLADMNEMIPGFYLFSLSAKIHLSTGEVPSHILGISWNQVCLSFFSQNRVDPERWRSVARFQFQRETGNCHLFGVSACKLVNGSIQVHNYMHKVNIRKRVICAETIQSPVHSKSREQAHNIWSRLCILYTLISVCVSVPSLCVFPSVFVWSNCV